MDPYSEDPEAGAVDVEEHKHDVVDEDTEAGAIADEVVATIVSENRKDDAKGKENQGGDEDVCTICLRAYTDGEGGHENFKLVLPCSHHFHVLCIAEWEDITSNCPLCRRNIV